MAIWQPKLAIIKKIKLNKMLLLIPKTIVNIIESKVRYIKGGLYLFLTSEMAPKIGPKTATKNVEMPKDML
jgi:hypothetical protein